MNIVQLLALLGVAVIVLCAVWYLLSQVPLDPMARKMITIVVVVIVAIICVLFLLSLGGVGTIRVGDLVLQGRAILRG